MDPLLQLLLGLVPLAIMIFLELKYMRRPQNIWARIKHTYQQPRIIAAHEKRLKALEQKSVELAGTNRFYAREHTSEGHFMNVTDKDQRARLVFWMVFVRNLYYDSADWLDDEDREIGAIRAALRERIVNREAELDKLSRELSMPQLTHAEAIEAITGFQT